MQDESRGAGRARGASVRVLDGGASRDIARDLDAERAVLGSMLLDPTTLASVRALLQPDMMFAPAHAAILEAFYALDDRGEQRLDVVTLAAELRAMERLNAVGGAQYLGELTDSIPTVAHVGAHAAIVRDCWRQRSVADLAMRLAHGAQGGAPFTDLRRAYEEIGDVLVDVDAQATCKPVLDVLDDYSARLESHAEGRDPWRLSWPWPRLRSWAGGPRGGQLITIAARPSVGKTALGEDLSLDFAQQLQAQGDTRAGLFLALEMDHFEWCARAVARTAKVDHDFTSLIRDPPQDEMTRMISAMNAIAGYNLYVDDASRHTPASVRALARRLHRTQGLAFIVVDYLQLMSADRAVEKRQLEIGILTRALKQLAKELDVPVIVLAQLNRENEKRKERPSLVNLREGGDIEQDSNGVMFLHRPLNEEGRLEGQQSVEIIELIVAKMRGARTGIIRLRFDKSFQCFVEVQENEDEFGEGADADAAPWGSDGGEFSHDDNAPRPRGRRGGKGKYGRGATGDVDG